MTAKKTGYPSKDRTHLRDVPYSKLHPTILPLNFLGTFLLINSRNLDEPALISRGTTYTGKKLREDVIRLAKALILLGFQRRDILAIITPNLYEGIALTMAANALGGKIAYLNNHATTIEHISELNRHEVDHLVLFARDEAYAKELTENIPTLRSIINIDAPYHSPYYISYDQLLARADRFRGPINPIFRRNLFNREETIRLQTSGSTSGVPKGLPFTNENVFAALIYAANSTGTKTNDSTVEKVLCVLPYRLPYGWMTIFVNLLGGNLVELADGGSVEDIANYWKTGASYIYGTPQIFRVFMDETPDDADLSFLKAFFCSGFSISEEWYQEGIKYLRRHNSQAEIRNNYGIGEALCIGTASDGVPHRPGTSGKFYVGPKWLIVNEALEEVKYGEIGEALLRSKSLFTGYFKDSEATERAFVTYRGKRYYRSGDYVSLSEDGYVTFVGRKKRFYQPLGATDKVNCETIEKALASCDLVESCAVVIYSPNGKSESSCAFLVPVESSLSDTKLHEKIYTHLSAILLDYQLPSKIEFLDQLPLMSSGKPDYTRLERLANQHHGTLS